MKRSEALQKKLNNLGDKALPGWVAATKVEIAELKARGE